VLGFVAVPVERSERVAALPSRAAAARHGPPAVVLAEGAVPQASLAVVPRNVRLEVN